jgi:hypothetical protein
MQLETQTDASINAIAKSRIIHERFAVSRAVKTLTVVINQKLLVEEKFLFTH